MENQNAQQIVEQLQQQVKELNSMDTAKTIDNLVEILGQLKTVATEKQEQMKINKEDDETQLKKDFNLLKNNLDKLPRNWYYTRDKKIYPSEFLATGAIENVHGISCYSLTIEKSFVVGKSIHFTIDTYGGCGPFYQDFHFEEWSGLYCTGKAIAAAESEFTLPLNNFFNGMVHFLKMNEQNLFYCQWLGKAALDAMTAMQVYVNKYENDDDAWVDAFKNLLRQWKWDKLDLCTMYATGQDQKIYAWYQELAKITQGKDIENTGIWDNMPHPIVRKVESKKRKAA